MSIEMKLAPDGSGAEINIHGHTVNVPLDHRTGGILSRILHAQRTASGPAALGLGTKAKPLQSMVDDWVRQGGVITRIEPKVPAQERPKVSINLGDLFPDIA